MSCNLCNRYGGDSPLLPNHPLLTESAQFLKNVHAVPRTTNKIIAQRKQNMKKAGVVPLICYRGFCIPLWTVFPPLQVVLSSACSVASLSRFPNHYLPGHPHLREGALAAYLFGQGSPSTWCAELTAIRETPTDTDPEGRQRMTSPDERNCNFVFCTQIFCSSELNNLLRGSVGLATHASCANQLKEIATVGPKPP